MGGAFADAVSERFQPLADGHDQGGRDGRAVDPIAVEVLGLQARVRWYLEEVGGEHGILVGSHALVMARGRQ